MPTIPSIRTAIENQNVLVLDDHAKKGTFRRDARNRLVAYAGGFSVVFPYKTTDGKDWAFRCWHSDISNTKKRYEVIAKAISKSNLGFLCDFDYIEKGINVDGEIYPTTRMRWVDGTSIKDYIWQNKDSKELLKSLATNFVKMTRSLHEKSLAHGDLQHGNILVDKKHNLHLVDYDSFYCPALKGEPDTITGLPDYQHPSRLINKTVSKKLDYFSELIIYLSILAIAERPSLAEKYRIKDADRLLFSKEDFEDICNSQIYHDIHSLGDNFIELLKILENYLDHHNINDLKPFELVLQENKILFASSVTKAIRNTQKVEISWSVPFESKITVVNVEKGDKWACQNEGTITTTLEETSKYELVVKTKDGQTLKKHVRIEVFDESEINFIADKYFVFPLIPVTISWSVTHAKNVWLNDEKVDISGAVVKELTNDSLFTLKVEDEFGIKTKEISIQLIPVPRITSIMVPTPQFNNNITINVNVPRLNLSATLPTTQLNEIIDINAPFVNLNHVIEPNISIKKTIKSSISALFNKLTNKY